MKNSGAELMIVELYDTDGGASNVSLDNIHDTQHYYLTRRPISSYLNLDL